MANTRVTNPVTGFNSATEEGLKLPSGTNANLPTGVQGMIRNDTDETGGDSSVTAIEHYNGALWRYFAATESPGPINGYYLVVAGGGGSAYGAGGAGGYLTNIGGTSIVLEKAITYTATVGVGGVSRPAANQPGGNGDPSEFSGTGITTITAAGGGGGADDYAGLSGGSGGGGGYLAGGGGAGNTPSTTPSQGNAGGNGAGGTNYAGGGGGGAFAAGENADGGSTLGSNGGDGLENNITGTPTYYAGGGGGIKYYGGTFPATTGGQGGGGAGGGSGTPGTDGLGGGAGGFVSTGGSGVVIIKYPTANNIIIASGTSPIAADLNATVAGSTTEKFTRFTATGAVTFTIT